MPTPDNKEDAHTPVIATPPGRGKQSPKYFTKGQSFIGYFLTIIISVFAAVIITLLAIPLVLGINPVDFYSGDLFEKSGSKTIIKAKQEENLISAVAEKVKPSVVTISSTKSSQGLLFPDLEPAEKSTGSGVIFKSIGYIITNNHVVEDADKISVTIGEATDIPAKLVAGDAENDIAVIKVNKSGLRAADFGSSKDLKVGELAVAIGSPFRFQHTVTSGIISAKNRAFGITDYGGQTEKTLTDLIQTDAAINPGNSGGALANEEGEVIGINTAIASTSGSSAGIGFAIPIERAKSVANQLITKGSVSHPYIGIGIDTITEERAEQEDIPAGVLVVQVMKGAPADAAGVKVGDVIIKVNGKKVEEADDLIAAIRRGKVGSKLSLTFIRDNKTKTATVTLAEKPSRLNQ